MMFSSIVAFIEKVHYTTISVHGGGDTLSRLSNFIEDNYVRFCLAESGDTYILCVF